MLAAVLLAPQVQAQIAFVGASQGNGALPIQFVASSSATSSSGTLTIGVPAGTLVGDLMLAQAAVRGGGTETFGIPAGWTEIGAGIHLGSTGTNTHKHRAYYKVATAGDLSAGSASWTFTGATATGGISSYRNVDPSSPVNAESSAGFASLGSSIDASSITTTVNGAMLVTFYGVNGDVTFTGPSGFTQRYSQNNGTQIDVMSADMLQATAGATGTQTATLSSSQNRRAARLIALAPLTNAVTVAVPAGTASGHVMVASIAVRPSTISITAPAGWTLRDETLQTAGNSSRMATYYRVAGGSEPASYTWTLSAGNTGVSGGIATFSGVDNATPVDVSSATATPSSLTHTAASVTTTLASTMLVGSFEFTSSPSPGNWNPAGGEGMTEAVDITSLPPPNDAGIALLMSYGIQAAAGASGTRSAVASGVGADTGVAHLLALRPSGTIQVVMTGSVDNINAGSIFLSGTRSGAPEAVNTSTNFGSATITTAITTLTNNAWLIDAVGSGNAGSFTPQAAQTERWDTSAASSTAAASTKPVPTAGASSMQQTHSTTSNRTAHAVVAIAPSGTIAFVSQNSANVNSSATLSWTHAVPASGKLIVGIGVETPGDPCPAAAAISSVTHNGVALTRAATIDANSASFCQRVEIWYLDFGVVVDHFSFSHAGSGVACIDHAITLTAHDSSHNPVDAGGRTMSLSTTNAKGTWTGIVAGGGVLSDPTPGDGAASYTFAGGSTQAQLSFRYADLATTSETFGFNASSGGLSETSGSAGPADDPSFTMTQAGFRFRNVTDGNTTIPTQLSGKPSNTGFNAKTIRIQAIDTNTQTGSCTALFASQTRTVDLGAECNTPGACAGRQVTINAGAIATSSDNAGAGASAYTGVSLTFNASSEADTVIAYPDAGRISLHARYDLDPGVAGFEMIGSSNAFVVRPFGLAFPGVAHSSSATGALLGAAGDNFTMTVQAYQWASGEDANNDGVPDTGVNITNNGTVPNFAATASVGRSANLPGVALGVVSRGPTCAGAATIALVGGTASATDWCYSEVGNVILTADVTNYLAAGIDITGNSGLDGDAGGGYVGRFRPKHFALSAGSLTNRVAAACAPASTFTYMDEGLSLGFTLTAQNTQNATTQNYTGVYAKLGLTAFANFNVGARSGTTNLTARVDGSIAPTGSWLNGVASPVSITTGIRRATPDSPDGPYPGLAFGIAPTDADGTAMNAFDLDVDGVGGNDHTTVATSVNGARFGRLRMTNALGSERLDLPVPIHAQYWNGSGFVTNVEDSCTAIPRAAFAMDFNPPSNLSACETAISTASVAFSSGVGSLTLTAPGTGNDGSVLLTANLGSAGGNACDPASMPAGNAGRSYLLGRWDATDQGGDGTFYDDKPAARAAFGLYGSQPSNFIYFRENY